MRVVILLSFLLIACGPKDPGDPDPEIQSLMLQQQADWNRGDIAGFMEAYADSICFIGKNGRTCGRDAVTRNYEKSYPDKATMGFLEMEVQEVLPAGRDHAWVTGTWELFREVDTVGGGFSLLWTRSADGWRIIRDHTY